MHKHNNRSPYNAHIMAKDGSGVPNKPSRVRHCGFGRTHSTPQLASTPAHASSYASSASTATTDRRRIFYNTKAAMRTGDNASASPGPESAAVSAETSPVKPPTSAQSGSAHSQREARFRDLMAQIRIPDKAWVEPPTLKRVFLA